MKRQVFLMFAAALLFAACSDTPEGPVSNADSNNPEVNTLSKPDGVPDLKDRYIVVFNDDVGNPRSLVSEMTRGKNIAVHYTYTSAIKGFAATIPEQALDGIRHNPNVAYVEPDGLVYKSTTQNNPPSWGLDRIDQHDLPLNSSYSYDQNEGEGVSIYIIDTGIRFDHQEFNNNRALSGYDFVDNDNWAYDCDGHGTHVAGTAAGINVGVAKKATLYAVRVLDCNGSGTYSGVIAGVDWVKQNAKKPAVANMSLGGGYSSSLNSAVNNAVSSGVVFAVSAGNSNRNACNYSPASAAAALTVGSTTSSDARSSFSNYGSCVDIFAPGSAIYSSTMTGTNTYATWSGTSMASPHVAGVAALYLGANSSATPSQVESAIKNGASVNKISNVGTGSPNLLLYNQITAPAPSNPPTAPSGLSASAVSSSQIDLSWTDNASDETGFSIWHSTDDITYTEIATVGANVKTWSHTGLTGSTQHWYEVLAYNSAGSSSFSNKASATTPAPTPPADPSNLQQTGSTATSVSMSWLDNSSDEDGFRVQRLIGSTWTTVGTTGTNVATFTEGGLSANSSYDYRVLAYKGALESNPSGTLTATTSSPTYTVHVSSITATASSYRSEWSGTFTVTIVDDSNNPVQGADVSIAFSDGWSGTASSVTDGNGQVQFSFGPLKKNSGTVTLTVTGVSATGYTYDASSNVETSDSVNKP